MNRALAVVGSYALAAASVAFGVSGVGRAAEAKSPEAARLTSPGAAEAARLVREALQAEVAGEAAARELALAGAIRTDPANKEARWQSGQLEVGGRWQSVADAERLAGSDSRRAEYRQLRDSLGAEPDDQRRLARWCGKQELAEEARFHWENVLRTNPDDKEARARLNLVAYRGDLRRPDEIDAEKLRQQQAKVNLKQFTPIFRQLVRDAASLDVRRREEALAAIRAMDDPAAMPALQQVVAVDAASNSGPLARLSKAGRDELLRRLNLAVVESLDGMNDPAATVDLTRYAVLAPWEEVRTGAAEALKSRKAEEYVPALMGELVAPMESRVDVTAAPDGTVGLTETITQRGPEGTRVSVRDTNYRVAGALTRDPRDNPARVLAGHLAQASSLAAETQANVAAANAAVADRNQRLAEVLAKTQGKELDLDVEQWWDQWKRYNELSSETPTVTSYQVQETTYAYAQFVPEGPASQGGAECFVAGTRVWTRTGPVAIERLTVGDFVLSQNPTTSELAYKPVLRTTVGKPARLARLDFAGETITSTLGHRYWVEGRGWEMAKAIHAPMAVRGLRGAIDFVASEPGPDDRLEVAHNLVVQDFGTYFVGQQRLLVHDITCPRPTRVLTPGLAPPEKARKWTIGAAATLR